MLVFYPCGRRGTALGHAHRRGAAPVRPAAQTRLLYCAPAFATMAEKIVTRVIVEGAAEALAGYRRQVNALLDEEYAGDYRELHAGGRLEYEVRAARGAPFPPFVSASADFPEVLIELSWTHPALGERGSATVRAGKLVDQARRDLETAGALAIEARAAPDGSWIGYAVTATQHAFFMLRSDGAAQELVASDGVDPEWAERWRIAADGAQAEYAELAPREPIAAPLLGELDGLATEFADGWIWFDAAPAAETAIERHRYGLYELAVHGANLRAERLRGAMTRTADGYVYEALGEAARPVAALVARHWAPAAGE